MLFNDIANISHHLLDPYIADNIGSTPKKALEYLKEIIPDANIKKKIGSSINFCNFLDNIRNDQDKIKNQIRLGNAGFYPTQEFFSITNEKITSTYMTGDSIEINAQMNPQIAIDLR